MSFNDIAGISSSGDTLKPIRNSASSQQYVQRDSQQPSRAKSEKFTNNTPFAQLGESLRDLQRLTDVAERKVNDYKLKRITPAQKNELEAHLTQGRDIINRLKIQFDAQQRQFESKNTPRTAESAQNRQAISKLFKEFDSLCSRFKTVADESSQIRVSVETNIPKNPKGISTTTIPVKDGMENDEFHAIGPPSRLIQSYADTDVDQAIIEEREREIRKINRDLILVNEMFRDVASLVSEQGTMIDKIADTTEQSHERAEAGLKQVQQAAANQSSCCVT